MHVTVMLTFFSNFSFLKQTHFMFTLCHYHYNLLRKKVSWLDGYCELHL